MSIEAISSAPNAISPSTAESKNSPAKILDAAKQFEALLMGQMLKSMHEAEGGWLGTGDDPSSGSAMEYAQEMFAQSLSANGGLGLASLLAKGLEQPSQR